MKEEYREENTTSSRIEGRHSVLEALRAGSLIERLFVQKGCQDGPVLTILREARRQMSWWTLFQKSVWIL